MTGFNGSTAGKEPKRKKTDEGRGGYLIRDEQWHAMTDGTDGS